MDHEKLKPVFELIELYHQIQDRSRNRDFLRQTQSEKNFSSTMDVVAIGSEIRVMEHRYESLQMEAERALKLYSQQKGVVNPFHVNYTFGGVKYFAYLTQEYKIEIGTE